MPLFQVSVPIIDFHGIIRSSNNKLQSLIRIIWKKKMEELTNHVIYELLKNKYSRLALDYVIFSADEYAGIGTHKNAVIKAFEIISKRYDDNYDVTAEKMEATLSDIDDFLRLPDDDYYNRRTEVNRGFSIPDIIPYWYAFLEPPYTAHYLIGDFIEFNDILFPNKQEIEVYRWNDDFSNYFDDGKEWWGTGLWSAYDKSTGIIVIIGASITD